MRIPIAVFVIALAGPFAAPVAAQDGPDPAGAPPGASSCSGCHGPGSAIRLDGLSADQIATAMRGFRDGSRASTLMGRLAKGFTEAEIVAISGWLAGEGADR